MSNDMTSASQSAELTKCAAEAVMEKLRPPREPDGPTAESELELRVHSRVEMDF